MATVDAYIPVNFFLSNFSGGIGQIVGLTPTAITIEFPDSYNYITGSFQYSAGALAGGTVNNWYAYDKAWTTTLLEFTGLSLPVATYDAFYKSGNSFAMLTYILDGNDNVIGSDYGDVMLGFNGNDTVYGWGGDDDINGNVGSDIVDGMLGNDFVRGGQNNDTVYGGIGADVVNGNLGNDFAYGGEGDDVVYGGQNEDVCMGEAGNDFISGDLGNDVLWGGAGADYFLFTLNAGSDVIKDFVSGLDHIALATALAPNVQAAMSGLTYSDGNAILHLNGVTVTIEQIAPNSLTTADFLIG